MITNVYKQWQADHTLFVKRMDRKVMALIVYVDDIMMTGNDEVEIAQLKSNLAKKFETKDLGSLKYFLGIEVERFKQGIFICQRKYIIDLLKDSGMMACKPCVTPIEVNHRLK